MEGRVVKVRVVKVRVLAVVASAALGVMLLPGPASAAPATYNVKDYGAKGNGSTLDDDAIDRAITAANAAGGGIVRFPAGTYPSRTIHLKSDVTLQLDSGATIRAVASGFDAPEPNPYARYQDYGHSHFHNSLMWGDGISNFAITGSGTIDGDGLTTANAVPSGTGDKTLVLTRCANVTISGVTFRRGGHFAVLTNGCHDVRYDDVKVLTSTDRDGINSINSWNVEVTNSRIEASDDALSFKSDYALGRTFTSEHIHVHDSTIRSTENNALQFGVESCGDFRDVVFEDLAITGAGKAGIGIVSHDGGSITDVHYARITMSRVSSPFFVRLGGRGSCPGNPPPGHVSGLTFTDITGTNLTTPADVQGDDEYASSLIGSPGAAIGDVSFTNVNLTVPGGHPASEANLVPPESLTLYRPREWGKRPAYGFWMRHVANVTFTNTVVQFDRNDGRPAFAVDDGRQVRWTDSRAERSTGGSDLNLSKTIGYAVERSTTTAGDPWRIKAVDSSPGPGPDVFSVPIEAESGQLTEPMRGYDDAAAPPTRYVSVVPGNNSKTSPPSTGTVTVTFTVPATATCKLWLRVIAANTGDDSFWVRLDTGPWVLWNIVPTGSAWHWADLRDSSGPVTMSLAAGAPHTVTVGYREDGAKLDRLVVTNDLGFAPPAAAATERGSAATERRSGQRPA
jgi:polygalacturonase